AVELTDMAQESLRILELIQHERQKLLIVAPFGELLRNLPLGQEPLVVRRNLSRPIDDKQAICCGVDGGLDERECVLEVAHRLRQVRNVPGAANQSERPGSFVSNDIATRVQ